MEPSWPQNHTQKQCYVKIAWKRKTSTFPVEFNDFSKFGDRFWGKFHQKINWKMTSKIAYLNWTHFGLKIGHKIPPRCSQDAHMRPQEGPRRSKTSPRRLEDASKTTPSRLPDASSYSQDALKTALNLPRHPKMLPRRLKTPQDASKTPRDSDFWRFLIDCWSIFDWFGINFWSIFHRFFSLHLRQFAA